MQNLFDVSYTELTNTAVWAWIISNEDSSDPELKDISRRLKKTLGVPSSATLISVNTNQRITPRDEADILAKYDFEGKELFLLIENKTAKDRGVVDQIKRYVDSLGEQGVKRVVPWIFTFDLEILNESIAEDLGTIEIMTVREMAELLNSEMYSNLILRQYASFLKKKFIIQDKIFQSVGIKEGAMDLAYWTELTEKNGASNLLELYIALADEIESSKTVYSKNRSVFIKTKRPIISAHPKKSNFIKGLWIGYSVTNLSGVYGVVIDPERLPVGFENLKSYQAKNEWRFGHLRTEDDVKTFIGYFRDEIAASAK